MDVDLTAERGKQVLSYEVVYEAVRAAGGWVTRKQIASRLERSVTPALRVMLDDMVSKGWLQRGFVTLPNGAKRFEYRLPEVE